MKTLIGLGLLVATASASRADVAWVHTGTVSMGNSKTPLATITLQNEWSGQKHRTVISYDATAAGAPAEMGKGSATAIMRFDDDHLILAASAAKKYVDEPIKTLPARLRINLWKDLDPALSADNVPALTLEQRQRLGQELRAVIAPFYKKVTRTYFRQMPDRTINGITTHGFRMTFTANIAMKKGGQEWIRAAAEWWLADDNTPGDDEVRAFTQQAQAWKKDAGGPTASMWLNEIFPVLWQSQPKELMQAWESLMGKEGTPGFGFVGTPVQMSLTLSPPPVQRMQTGDIHLTLELKKRDQSKLDPTIFDAPAGYERVELEPLLEQARKGIEQAQSAATAMMP